MHLPALTVPRFGKVSLALYPPFQNRYVLKLTDEDATSSEAQALCVPGEAEIPFYLVPRCKNVGETSEKAEFVFHFAQDGLMPKNPPEEAGYGATSPTKMNAFISLLQRAKSASPGDIYQHVKASLASDIERRVENADWQKSLADAGEIFEVEDRAKHQQKMHQLKDRLAGLDRAPTGRLFKLMHFFTGLWR